MTHVLQALVVVLVVVKLELLRRHNRWGWALAVGAEVPWLILSVFVWRSWGAIALSGLYGAMSARNWYAWRSDPSAAETPTAPEQAKT